MRDDIAADIRARLKRDYQMRETREGWLRRGKCPQCGQRELYASGTAPWAVRCGRLNKCGYEQDTKSLYPDAFGRLNERFPSTSEKPNETAHAYMGFVRGLPNDCRGWYRQGRFSHPRGDRETATVLFQIAPDVWMERLVEPVRIREDDGVVVRKQHFHGSHKGLAWAPPKQAPADELWIVEGCIDAVTLACAGRAAIATLSAVNYPGEYLQGLRDAKRAPTLVWALDNDPAGRDYARRHIARARKDGWDCAAALVPQDRGKKRDWNDLWLAGALAEDRRDDTLDRCRFHGDLFLAPSPKEKGLLIYRRKGANGFALDYDRQTYWFQLDQEKYNKAVMDGNIPKEDAEDMAAQCHRIANCTVQFLYFQQSRLTDESWYYTRIDFPHERSSHKNTFRGAEIASASEFKKRLLSIAPGALWTGSSPQLNWIMDRHLRNIRVVETVEYIGYSRDHQAYIFPSFAIRDGKVYELNDEDFFEIGRLSVKSLNASLDLHIGTAAEYRADWPDLVYRAFGAQGLIAAAFFLGSLLAEQVRGLHKSFPFLEIVGEAGAGKSTLIEFLWKLLGRADYEGFDPNKSTQAARSRIFTQVSNLPVSLIESDREDTMKQKQFDWDELKTAYNGRPARARGVKNSGNDTYEPPFRGSILISQNAPVNASEAIMQRIVHLMFDCSGHSMAGKAAADELASLPVERLSHWLVMACQAEARVLDTVRTRAPLHEAALMAGPAIRSHRIAKNHGQMMALAEALCGLCDIQPDRREEVLTTLRTAAALRQEAIASDHPIIEEFWEMVEFLDPDLHEGTTTLNHARDRTRLIAVNLNQVMQNAQQRQQPLPAVGADLKRHLKSSKSRKFLGIRTVNSGVSGEWYGRSVKCWCFQAPNGRG